jgi:pyridoxal phosphate enzyme (YggS family)
LAELITGLEVERVAANLQRVRTEIAATGRDPDEVEILAATKYVASEELPVLAEAGVSLVGENRAQDLVAKAAAHQALFTWDFIGHLQSRKVGVVLPHVRHIHSVASESALKQLAHHGGPDTEVLVEVNVAREAGKSGLSPDDLAGFLDRSPVRVVGLMTMPPLASRPQDSRPHFAALRGLAERNGLTKLSMGTSQDYLVAVQEGATIVRLGTTLYLPTSGGAS